MGELARAGVAQVAHVVSWLIASHTESLRSFRKNCAARRLWGKSRALIETSVRFHHDRLSAKPPIAWRELMFVGVTLEVIGLIMKKFIIPLTAGASVG